MKTVKFVMYFEVCGQQTIQLPDCIDASDEDAVKQYIDDHWDHIKLPNEYEYVGDNGFDFDSPIEIIDEPNEEPDFINGAPNYDKFPGWTPEQVLAHLNID